MADGSQIITTDQTEAPALATTDPMMGLIEKVMLSPDVPMDRLDKLLDLRERQMAKEAEQEFNRAFAAAMAEMPTVKRTATNGGTRSQYATLDDLIKAARPALSRHGLSLNWQVDKIEGGIISVTAFVRHSSGHSISTTDTAPADKGSQMNAIQGGGSTQTYLKRYTGFAILGMASGDEQDDDGRGADKEPEQFIHADHYRALMDEIDLRGGSTDALQAFLKVDDLHQITEGQFWKAMAALRKRPLVEKPEAEAA